jgi:hypothetical protein
MNDNTVEYVHQPLNREVSAIGGSYILIREVRLPVYNKEVLYLLGHGIFDSTCCGAGGCGYALVQGQIIRWQHKQTPDGEPVSEVARIRVAAEKEQIEALIKKKELVQQVVFL